ncbi:MAG TPA: colanic acid biosynthesis glycosyltransferase WcaL [Anaerolineae bacterium]|nr:colanic acid biosynthesis glycosyltransferase WcaL [Anaerolineae bacterium]
MTLKIAYILKMYPRFSETFIVNEILELERQGVDVTIYSLRMPDDGRFHAKLAQVKAPVIYAPQYPDKEPERVEAAQDYLYARFPVQYLRWHEYALSRGNPYAVKRFQQACVIAAHLCQHPVHAMHAHFASSAARVANYIHGLIDLPYSITAHAKDIYHEDVQPKSLRKKMRDARFTVTVSRYNQAHLQALMGEEAADIRCLYNGIDLTRFCPDTAVPRQDNLILGVGRLVEKKGFDTLIRACAILQERGVDFQCQIIGKGGLREALAGLIAELGVGERVQLAGAKPQDGVLTAYRQAAVFALPCVIGSDGNRDGLPTVLLEAMAAGLPVISTPVTGNPEIIDDGVNGRLVPPGDAAALAEALADLLQNPQRRQAMSAAARQKVERAFDVRRNVAQLHEWLAEPTAVTDHDAAYQPRKVIIRSPYAPLVWAGAM